MSGQTNGTRADQREVEVFFQATITYVATMPYANLVELAAADGDVKVPPWETLAQRPHTMDEWAGSDLADKLWETGKQVDSTETRVVELRPTLGADL